MCDRNLPHFDGFDVLENETGDLRLMKTIETKSDTILSSRVRERDDGIRT